MRTAKTPVPRADPLPPTAMDHDICHVIGFEDGAQVTRTYIYMCDGWRTAGWSPKLGADEFMVVA